MRIFLLLVALFSAASFAEGITVSEEKRQEMIARLLRIGMNNTRSNRAEDLNKVVCMLRERTGSRVKDCICGTNSALNYEREISLRGYGSGGGGSYGGGSGGGGGQAGSAVTGRGSAGAASRGSKETEEHVRIQEAAWVSAFGSIVAANPQGPIIFIQATSRGRIHKQIEELASDVSEEESRKKLVRDMTWTMFVEADGRHGWSADDYTGFVLAYKHIDQLEDSSFDSDAELEAAMMNAITEQGLTIETYNTLMDQVMGDESLRARVLVALKIQL